MEKMRSVAVLVVLLCAMCAPCLATNWVYDPVVSPYSGDYDYGCTSIALNADGNPIIAYSGSMNPVPRVAHKVGSTWVSEIADTSGYIGQRGLALDSSGNPHLLYSDFSDPYNPILKYSYWNGTDWTRQTIGTGFGSLRLDGDDLPHILYSGDGSGVKYTYWTGTSWAAETVTDAAGASGADLALDEDGNPRILYCDGGTDLRYAYKIGESWDSEYVASASSFVSLALGPSGDPRVAHMSGSDMIYSHKAWDGESWIWTPENVSDGGDYCSLVVDSDGIPSICYQFCNPSDPSRQIKYSRKSGSWATEVLRGASYMSLTLDGAGNPHISCNGDNYAGLSYITGTVPEPSGLLALAGSLAGLIVSVRRRLR